jgi:prepilin-type N-terminal cleavage/methylation domain-containing protein
MINPKNKKYSFTLVELMIVLAILALLAGIVIFVVKPGNILDQVKDYQRVSDLNNISKSINYLNTIQLGLLNLGSATTIYVSLPDNTSTTCSSYTLPSLPTGYGYICKDSTNYQNNDSTG